MLIIAYYTQAIVRMHRERNKLTSIGVNNKK